MGPAIFAFLLAAVAGWVAVGRPGTSTGDRPRAQLVPTPGNEASAQATRALAAAIEKVWPEVTGLPGPVPAAAMELICAQARAEGCAQWGGFNYGCHQCREGSQAGDDYTCDVHKDSRPDPANPTGPNIEYSTGFRHFETAEAGARDFLTSLIKTWPTLPAMRAGSILDFARLLGLGGYFEGFNPESPNGGGVADWRTRWATTIAYLMSLGGLDARAAKVKATPEQVAGRIAVYARAMGKRVPEVAHALGHTSVAAYMPADLA